MLRSHINWGLTLVFKNCVLGLVQTTSFVVPALMMSFDSMPAARHALPGICCNNFKKEGRDTKAKSCAKWNTHVCLIVEHCRAEEIG